MEVGIGTGRFAGPLNIDIGVEPAKGMRRPAQAKGLTVVGGAAEALPFGDAAFVAKEPVREGHGGGGLGGDQGGKTS